MYVSITGLRTKGIVSWFKFWTLAIPAFKSAKTAKGIVFCEAKSREGYHHTLTVWETHQHMENYRASPVHLKAMKTFSQIATGKVIGYESKTIPSWEVALSQFDKQAKQV